MLRVLSIGALTALLVTGLFSLIGFAIAPHFFAPSPNLYRGSDFRFELPRDWKCEQDETDFVCRLQGEQKKKKRSAIIIFARKWIGPMDRLDKYIAHLKKPVRLKFDGGKEIVSQVIYVRRKRYGSHIWVDGKHLNSELPNYYTRYLATTTSHIGLLVTYSVHIDAADELEPALESALNSVRISQRSM